MTSSLPRAVVVTRPTEFTELLARHATRAQAAFFLQGRGQELEPLEALHQEVSAATRAVLSAIPTDWRRAQVTRGDLDRFLFGPDDVVLVVGQDGLVANVARFLDGQPVVGINPAPSAIAGVLVRHRPKRARELMRAAAAGEASWEQRTMVSAETRDGQRLMALNEIFVGHRSHQSARYWVGFDGDTERQSSSGLIVATGTGATGWASSIRRNRVCEVPLPAPTDSRLAFFVREAWPSPHTGVRITDGVVTPKQPLSVRSEMNAGGVIFGDGIEGDFIDFHYGQEVEVSVSPTDLRLLAA